MASNTKLNALCDALLGNEPPSLKTVTPTLANWPIAAGDHLAEWVEKFQSVEGPLADKCAERFAALQRRLFTFSGTPSLLRASRGLERARLAWFPESRPLRATYSSNFYWYLVSVHNWLWYFSDHAKKHDAATLPDKTLKIASGLKNARLKEDFGLPEFVTMHEIGSRLIGISQSHAAAAEGEADVEEDPVAAALGQDPLLCLILAQCPITRLELAAQGIKLPVDGQPEWPGFRLLLNAAEGAGIRRNLSSQIGELLSLHEDQPETDQKGRIEVFLSQINATAHRFEQQLDDRVRLHGFLADCLLETLERETSAGVFWAEDRIIHWTKRFGQQSLARLLGRIAQTAETLASELPRGERDPLIAAWRQLIKRSLSPWMSSLSSSAPCLGDFLEGYHQAGDPPIRLGVLYGITGLSLEELAFGFVVAASSEGASPDLVDQLKDLKRFEAVKSASRIANQPLAPTQMRNSSALKDRPEIQVGIFEEQKKEKAKRTISIPAFKL